MSGLNKVAAMAAAAMVAASCADGVRIDGEIPQAASSEIVLKALDVNRYQILDTLDVDASGKFSYKLDVEAGQPEFVYIFHGDRKIASMLLSNGEKVQVKADTLGNYDVTGSEESLKLLQVEKDYAAASARFDAIARQLQGASGQEAADLNKALVNEYVSYYRNRLEYVMNNSKSLTVVPVFYQVLGNDLMVFAQLTDGIHFNNICDSLETVYPSSKYVKALRNEAQARISQMQLNAHLESAKEIGFPDIILPDVKGQKQQLSAVDAKVILLQFWIASDAAQKMFNQDVLKPVYDEYHKKGFEIFQVSLDIDKAVWANVLKEQNLPWINVCDALGANSPYANLYNIGGRVPAMFIIADGELVNGSAVDEKTLRQLIGKLLKK